MPTIMAMRWEGVTQEQYDQVMDKLGLDENPPEGGIFHVSGLAEDGLRVVDVWDSQEQFERFLQERLQPVVQEVGLPGEPQVEFVPLHNVWAPRGEELMQRGAKAPVG